MSEKILSASDIPRRIPVLDAKSEGSFPAAVITRQWQLITEFLKRQIQTNSGVRQAVIPFISVPVSENLPNQIVTTASSSSERIRRLQQKNHLLDQYLGLPEVPDELIRPDIQNAPSYSTPEDDIAFYEQHAPKEVPREILEAIASGKFLHGITKEERKLIAQRYQMARDCKLLCLAAELLNIPNIPSHDQEIILPSSTKFFINPDVSSDREALLNPLLWVKRKMIKDRVFDVEIAGKHYILKERKTAKHTDTKRHGHQPGLTSQNEFTTAENFRRNGKRNKDGIMVSWEKPIAYAEFPDGYQCTLFEFEKGLMSGVEARSILTQEIINHSKDFQKEYELIRQKARELKRNTATRSYPDIEKELSFESFARVKADYWMYKASDRMKQVYYELNYSNNDLDGYAFRIHLEPLTIETVGMDFEYCYPINPVKAKTFLQRHHDYQKEHIQRNGILMVKWQDRPVYKIEQAAYLALFEANEQKGQ